LIRAAKTLYSSQCERDEFIVPLFGGRQSGQMIVWRGVTYHEQFWSILQSLLLQPWQGYGYRSKIVRQ